MTVPSPATIHKNGSPLRIRGRSMLGKYKWSCHRAIVFLLAAQMVGMMLVELTGGNSDHSAMQGDTAGRRETALDSEWPETDPIARRRAELDEGDFRSNRVVYSEHHQSLALDDYGAQKHFSKRTDWEKSAPYLIVGGSDGSGTRAVVNQLVELGANFHVEDKRTMDVHGTEMFQKGGWPPLVNLIMNATHSANYEVKDLPPKVKEEAIFELTKLKKSMDRRLDSRLRYAKPGNFATATFVGWKAPASMLLLPLLREVFGRIKFLHVVRDGRDVSLSDNQSPVKKFYNIYYGLPPLPPPDEKNSTTCAMQLWNDMNQQVMEWGKSHSDGETFDYLTIRTEDLVSPETKFDALLQLADFVGSKTTITELCCISQREVQDLGKSSKTFTDPKQTANRAMPGRGGNFMGLGVHQQDWMAKILGKQHRPEEEDFLPHHDPEMEAYRRRKDLPSNSEMRRHREEHDLELRNRIEQMQKKRAELLHLRDNPKHDGTPKAIQALLDQRRKRDLERRIQHDNPRRRLLEKKTPAELLAERKMRIQRLRRPLGPGGRFGYGRDPVVPKEAPEQVKARYGKWVKALESQPELSIKLHELGRDGLEAFGYEPQTGFLDPPDQIDSLLPLCQAVLEEKLCKAK